jgi:hypothetical protein
MDTLHTVFIFLLLVWLLFVAPRTKFYQSEWKKLTRRQKIASVVISFYLIMFPVNAAKDHILYEGQPEMTQLVDDYTDDWVWETIDAMDLPVWLDLFILKYIELA